MSHSAAIGAGRNPRFGGGSLSSPRIFLYQHAGSRLVGANHGKQKTSRDMVMPHPPLCPWGKKHAVLWDTKITLGLAPQTGSENRVARYVE